MKKSLIACNYLFALSKAQDDNKLYDLKIAVVGKWKGHIKGPFELTFQDLEQIKANFEKMDIEVVCDYEHASLYEEKAPASGWIKELFFKDKELWAKVQWLPDALELIKGEEYKYHSPVLDPQTIDQVTGDNLGWSLHSVALTNRPFFEELGEVFANKKQTKQEGEESMFTKEEFEALQKENQDLKDEKAAAEVKRVEDEIDGAIAAKKIHPDQKESLLAFGKVNPEGLTNLLAKAKVISAKPEDNLYANDKDGGQKKNDTALTDAELKA
jgi:phage I-like protein